LLQDLPEKKMPGSQKDYPAKIEKPVLIIITALKKSSQSFF